MATPAERDMVPHLDAETIITAISEVSEGNVTVTVEELKKLKPQKALEIYRTLVFTCFESSSEQLRQAHFKDIEGFRYPNLYEEAASRCNLGIALEKVMKCCGVNNFSMSDILVPKPKRTHKLLSALVNYSQFRFSKESVADNAFQQSDELKRKNMDLQERKTSFISRIAELKERKFENQQRLAQLTPSADAHAAEYNKEIDQQEKRTKQAAEQASVVKQQADLLETLKLVEAINKSRTLDVDGSSLLNRLSFKERQLCDLEEAATTALKLGTALVASLEKHTISAKSLVVVRDKVRAQEQNYKELVAILQNFKRQEHSKHEKLTRLSIQHRKRLSSTIELTELEKKKRAALKSDFIVKVRNQLEEVETEQREISKLMDLRNLEFEEKMKLSAKIYGQLLDQLDVFHHSLTKGWEMITPFFADDRT